MDEDENHFNKCPRSGALGFIRARDIEFRSYRSVVVVMDGNAILYIYICIAGIL